jgi:hypothetical protein
MRNETDYHQHFYLKDSRFSFNGKLLSDIHNNEGCRDILDL